MFARFANLTRYAADGTAPGSPAVGAAPATGTPAPGPDVAALVAEAVRSQVSPLLEKLTAKDAEIAQYKASLDAKDKDAAGAVAAKATAEEQIKALTSRFNETASASALHAAAGRFNFVNGDAREAAVALFKAKHKVEARDSGEVEASVGGKTEALGAAFEAFAKSPAVSLLIAASAQPGAGATTPSAPAGAPKSVKEMTDAEFDAGLAAGIFRGKFTNSNREPESVIQSKPQYFAKRREELIGAALRKAKPA